MDLECIEGLTSIMNNYAFFLCSFKCLSAPKICAFDRNEFKKLPWPESFELDNESTMFLKHPQYRGLMAST